MKRRHIFAFFVAGVWFLGFRAGVPAAQGAEISPRTLRLFAVEGDHKRYFTGYDWLLFDLAAKTGLVEKARQGAARMNVAMTLPSRVYVRELDHMYRDAPEVRHIEVGQAIQGIAISLKDWDDGGDPEKRLKDALDEK